MARKLRERTLDTRAARKLLPVSGKPIWREVAHGIHLGFRKGQRQGVWVVRLYHGRPEAGGSPYTVEKVGLADDDRNDADGVDVLTFHQAVDRARTLTPPATRSGPYTVADAIRDYLTAISAKRSAYHNGKVAEVAILPTLGDIQVARLTAERIRSWLTDVTTAPPRWRPNKKGESSLRPFDRDDPEAVRRRRSTANRMLTVLKAALNFAFAEGKVSSDSAWRRVKPYKGADAARVRYLTTTEAARLLKACDGDFRDLVRAGLNTGCRYGELTRLTVADFDPRAGTITVRQSKSGKPRHVVLTDTAIDFFKKLAKGRSPTDTLLTRNGKPWGPSEQIRPMTAAVAVAKLTGGVSFHTLRHTYASLTIMGGVPLQVVARNLGHADARMCERHYGHLSQSFVADAIRAGAPVF